MSLPRLAAAAALVAIRHAAHTIHPSPAPPPQPPRPTIPPPPPPDPTYGYDPADDYQEPGLPDGGWWQRPATPRSLADEIADAHDRHVRSCQGGDSYVDPRPDDDGRPYTTPGGTP